MSPESYEVCYHIRSDREYAGYKLAVWDIPRAFADSPAETNADEYIRVQNAEGDCRGILVFDLQASPMSVRLRLARR